MSTTVPVQQLPPTTTLGDGDVLPVGQGTAALKKATLQLLVDYLKGKFPPVRDGVDGNTIHYGEVPPLPELGNNGDFYIKSGATLYGPKAVGAWPAPTALVGGSAYDVAVENGYTGTEAQWAADVVFNATAVAADKGAAEAARDVALAARADALAAATDAHTAAGNLIDDAIATGAAGANLVTRSAQMIGTLIATLTRVAVDRAALAGTAFKSVPTYMPEGRASSWWDFSTTAAYAAEHGSTTAADLAIDTRQGVIVAASDGTGVWVRRHGGRLSPFHFGAVGKIEGQTTGWVDDAPALNAWAAWIVSRINRRVLGEATGKFVINSQVTIGNRVTAYRGGEFIGSMELFANAAMDRMLETGRIDYFQWTGQLHLFGGGANTDSGDVTWANRLAKVGWYNFGCTHTNVDVFHARFFQVAGYFTAASTGIESTDSSRFGLMRLHYCGSGKPGTDSLEAAYSTPVNSGVGGSTGQYTTLAITGTLPPSYLTDLTGGNAAFNGGATIPIGAMVSGRVYQVAAVDYVGNTVQLYPWLDATVASAGTITWIFGAGNLDRGSDANVYDVALIDVQNNGVGIWDLALYGPHISQIQASGNGVGYMWGRDRAASNIGGGFDSFYPEGNTNDIVGFINFSSGAGWKNGNFGQYEANLAKCYIALVPRNADNSFDASQSMFARMGMTLRGQRHEHRGHPGNNANYANAALDWTLGAVPQVFAGVGSATVTLHAPGTVIPGGVNDDRWSEFADLNRLFGHDSAIAVFAGTAANGVVGGTLTFQAPFLSRTAAVVSGNAVITGLATTLGLVAGMIAQAAGSAATTILTVDGPNQITLTAAPTANATSIKLPAASVNGGATAVFSGFAGGAAVFASYYRFATNDIIIRQTATGTPAVQTVVSAATVTPAFGNDQVNITAQAAPLALANFSGTAIPAWGCTIRVNDDGTARAITWGTKYRGIGGALPTTTTAGKTMYISMVYNSTVDKFDVFPALIEP